MGRPYHGQRNRLAPWLWLGILDGMTRRDLILAALATSRGEPFTPVQVQKMFFLIDQKAAHLIGGKKFDFAPYDYGPFDSSIYDDLSKMNKEGLIEIIGDAYSKGRKYCLLETAQIQGEKILKGASPNLRDYFVEVSKFVRSLSFAELVSSIYAAYPEMKIKSVFRE